MKNQMGVASAKMAHYETEIAEQQNQVKDRMAETRELKLQIEALKKEQKALQREKDEQIANKDQALLKSKEDIESAIQRAELKEQEITKRHSAQCQDYTQKIETLNSKITELESVLKTEKEGSRLLKLKVADLLSTIDKKDLEKEGMQA